VGERVAGQAKPRLTVRWEANAKTALSTRKKGGQSVLPRFPFTSALAGDLQKHYIRAAGRFSGATQKEI